MKNIGKLIESNSYPGRGIIIGKTVTTAKAVTAYFIMGRSENSRNRVFKLDGDSLSTRPYDESKVEDPSLIIYSAINRYDNRLIITNGDQTDTIIEFLSRGLSFEDALATRKFEPDFPNMTPRISGIIYFDRYNPDFAYKLSILKSMDSEGSNCSRFFFNYESKAGLGHFIHTYKHDGNPLPSFEGEPESILIPDSIDEFTETLWDGLDNENRISLYARYTDAKTGTFEDRLINKNIL